jgi:hypothetical protein
VEYSHNYDKSKELQAQLDWMDVEGAGIHCDLIAEPFMAYSKLHSRCLLIDNLPKDFKDATELREIFSKHSSPMYCQVNTSSPAKSSPLLMFGEPLVKSSGFPCVQILEI